LINLALRLPEGVVVGKFQFLSPHLGGVILELFQALRTNAMSFFTG
jgi:hypothetical protein